MSSILTSTTSQTDVRLYAIEKRRTYYEFHGKSNTYTAA